MDSSGNEKADTNCCICPQFHQFGGHVQHSTGSSIVEIVDHMDSCGNWLEAVVDIAGSDSQRLVSLTKKRPLKETSVLVRGMLVNNLWTVALDLCPAGPVHDSLNALLLMSSVRYSLGDLAMNIIQREWVSDSQVMEAILFAVYLRDKCTFLKLIRGRLRNRCIFKQEFVPQHCRENLQSVCAGEEGGCYWVYRTLYEGGDKDLALFVAATHQHQNALFMEFCREEADNFDLRQDMNKLALKKLYEYGIDYFRDFVKRLYKSPGRSRSDQSFLIRQALRVKEYDLFITLCHCGVSQKDLTFCASFLLSGKAADCEVFLWILGKLELEDRKLLRLHAVKVTMNQYFKLKSTSSLETFIELFPNHDSDDASPIMGYLFKKAILKCEALNCVDCFIRLCMKYCGCEDRKGVVVFDQVFKFACKSAMHARPRFIVKMLEKHIKFVRITTLKLSFLLDFALREKAWNVVPILLSDASRWGNNSFKLLEKCLHHMLSDQSTWSGLGQVLDKWLKEDSLINCWSQMNSMQQHLTKHCLPFSVSSLIQWCVDNGHPILAFFLSMVSQNWEMMETVLTSLPSLELDPGTFWIAVELAAQKGLYSLGVAMLKIYPINAEVLNYYDPFDGSSRLVSMCEDQGLLDWALVLESDNLTYLREHRTLYENPNVWDWLVKRAVSSIRPDSVKWDIVKEFISSSADSELLKTIVKCLAPADVVEALLSHVDPTECVLIDAVNGDKTLLFSAINTPIQMISEYLHIGEEESNRNIKTISLFLASGLSTFQRNIPQGPFNCPASCALSAVYIGAPNDIPYVNILVRLMLDCGAIPYKGLHKIADDIDLQEHFTGTTSSEEWKEAFRSVQEAAGTPCSLQHLARLAVSHSIGCQPGRADRINSLPLPQMIKDKVNFKDVLTEEVEDNAEEDHVDKGD